MQDLVRTKVGTVGEAPTNVVNAPSYFKLVPRKPNKQVKRCDANRKPKPRRR